MNLIRGKLRILIPALVGFLLLALVSMVIYYQKREQGQGLKGMPEVPLERVFVYLPSSNSTTIKREFSIKKEESELRRLELILSHFFRELPSTFGDTKINEVYRDRENNLYIDLSSNFSTPTDAKEEFLVLKSLILTIRTNFSWVKDVKILISGEEVETVSGHVSAQNLRELLEVKE